MLRFAFSRVAGWRGNVVNTLEGSKKWVRTDLEEEEDKRRMEQQSDGVQVEKNEWV